MMTITLTLRRLAHEPVQFQVDHQTDDPTLAMEMLTRMVLKEVRGEQSRQG